MTTELQQIHEGLAEQKQRTITLKTMVRDLQDGITAITNHLNDQDAHSARWSAITVDSNRVLEAIKDNLYTYGNNFMQMQNSILIQEQQLQNIADEVKKHSTPTTLDTTKFDDLKSAMSTLQGTISDVPAQFENVLIGISQLKGAVGEVHDTVDVMPTQFGDMKIGITQLQNIVNNIPQQFETVITCITNMQEVVTHMRADIADIADVIPKRFDDLKCAMSHLNDIVDNINGMVTQHMPEQFESLKTEVLQVQSLVNSVHETLKQLKTQNTLLSKENSGLSYDNAILRQDMNFQTSFYIVFVIMIFLILLLVYQYFKPTSIKLRR